MDATTFLAFLSVVLAGGVVFTLIMVSLDRALDRVPPERRRRLVVKSAAEALAEAPAVIAAPDGSEAPAFAGFRDGLLVSLEDHVRAEHAMASSFVHFPSVDSLYRPAGPSARPTMH